MNLSAFLIAIIAKNNLNAENIEDYKGLGYRNPVISAFMVITLIITCRITTHGWIYWKVLFISVYLESNHFIGLQ